MPAQAAPPAAGGVALGLRHGGCTILPPKQHSSRAQQGHGCMNAPHSPQAALGILGRPAGPQAYAPALADTPKFRQGKISLPSSKTKVYRLWQGTWKRVLEHYSQSIRLTASQSVRQAGRQAGSQAVSEAGRHAGGSTQFSFFGGSLQLPAMVNLICAGKTVHGQLAKHMFESRAE